MTLIPMPLRTAKDIAAFEAAMPLAQRLVARSIYDVFVAAAARHPERIAITMIATGAVDERPARLSYRELLGQIERAANLFVAIVGQRPGVAYMLPNLVETHVILWGAETAGFVVPINYLLQAEHIAELLRASGASILVALGPHPQLDIWDKALDVARRVPQIQLVRVVAHPAAAVDGVLDFHERMAAQPQGRLVFGQAGRDADIAAYFHTGGTTGAPKLVAHTHRNQLAAAYGGAQLARLSDSDVITVGSPLFHVAATIFGGLCCFLSGVEVLLLSAIGFRNPAIVKNFWKIVQTYRATLVGAVPTALGAILEVPIEGADISSIRAGSCGAAPLPRVVGERFEQRTGKHLHEILGMTEAAGLVCIDPFCGLPAAASVGYALPYTEVVIRRQYPDGSLGEPCEPGAIGILTVRGPTVSPGYKNPEQNLGVFVDGTLNSGDLAYAGADGRIHIAGRAKDLIIRGGHNIDPQMIENAMARHPNVAMAAAVGMPDAHAGELPVCYVTLKPGAQVGQAELRAHAQRSIAGRPAWPKHIFVVDAIPTTSVGKIYKPQLRVDAATRLVQHIVQGEHNFRGARIEVTEGGKRGLRVSVILAEAHSSGAPQLRQALAASFLNRPCALAERSGSIERHTLLATLARGAGAAAPSAP